MSKVLVPGKYSLRDIEGAIQRYRVYFRQSTLSRSPVSHVPRRYKKILDEIKKRFSRLSTLEQVMQRPRKGGFPVEQMRTTKNFTR